MHIWIILNASSMLKLFKPRKSFKFEIWLNNQQRICNNSFKWV